MRLLLLNLIWIPFEFTQRAFFEWMLGCTDPPLDSWNRAKHHWKALRGIHPVSVALDNQNGYLGWKRTYSDDGETFIR